MNQEVSLTLPRCWNCVKHISVVYEPPNLWYSSVAASIDSDSLKEEFSEANPDSV